MPITLLLSTVTPMSTVPLHRQAAPVRLHTTIQHQTVLVSNATTAKRQFLSLLLSNTRATQRLLLRQITTQARLSLALSTQILSFRSHNTLLTLIHAMPLSDLTMNSKACIRSPNTGSLLNESPRSHQSRKARHGSIAMKIM